MNRKIIFALSFIIFGILFVSLFIIKDIYYESVEHKNYKINDKEIEKIVLSVGYIKNRASEAKTTGSMVLDLNTGKYNKYNTGTIIKNISPIGRNSTNPFNSNFTIKDNILYNNTDKIRLGIGSIGMQYKYWTKNGKYLIITGHYQKCSYFMCIGYSNKAVFLVNLENQKIRQYHFFSDEDPNLRIIDVIGITD